MASGSDSVAEQTVVAEQSVVAELSVAFREELTARVQGAFGLALELAVAEVTELVGRALRDVHERLRETLRAKRELETRAQAAETQLRAARTQQRRPEAHRNAEPDVARRCEELGVCEGEPVQNPTRPFCEIGPDGIARTPDPKAKRATEHSAEFHLQEISKPLNRETGPDGIVRTPEPKAKRTTEHSAEFHLQEITKPLNREIGPDGIARTPEPKAKRTKEHSAEFHLQEITNMKQDHGEVQDHVAHFHRGGLEASVKPEASEAHVMDCITRGSAVEVKKEQIELDADPEHSHLSEQDFSSESISLVQSRFLEDWRPEPFQSDLYTSSSGITLGDIPDLDLHALTANQPDSFPQSDATSNDTPHQMHLSQNSGHNPSIIQNLHRISGQPVKSVLDELHQHIYQPDGPRHNSVPPGRSLYRCSQCGRDFNRMEHLKIHQRIHTGEKPYSCAVCSARFRHSWALKRHFRIHTGEKPYMCTQCGKTFRNCGGLRFHQRSHARDKVG